jgi:hypothetical protein
MAWRIHDTVIRGEIDNREKGHVTGRLWLDGIKEPVLLQLQGNCWPDLAGCRLEFRNPRKTLPLRKDDRMAPVQEGTAGDITASRKVRVYAIPVEEAYRMCKRGEKPPEHMANCLYLEWFSVANGRVVIESTDYELTLSQPQWRLTPEEDAERARQAAAGMANFMQRLTEAIERQQRSQKDPEEEWDEHDYEKFMKECDARTDKYIELLDKYGDSEEAEARIAREMGWERDLTEEEAEEQRLRIEEMNAACAEALDTPEPTPDPQREGIDWIRTEHGDLEHPLQHRSSESAMKLWHQCDDLGGDLEEDDDVGQLISEFQITGAKLAGALNGIARGENRPDEAFTVACLKRALNHLHQALAGLEAAAKRKVLPAELVTASRTELFAIREGILELMEEFRRRS